MKFDEILARRGADPEVQDLLRLLKALWGELQVGVNGAYQRTLPFGDYVVDRWERARRLNFGEGASIYDSSLVLGDVVVGEKTWIGPFTVLDGSGGRLEIGAYCSIASGVQIYTHDTVGWAVTGGAAPPARAPTTVGSRCYIGPMTVIARGVTIGEGCIIGAHSLVLSDIPARSEAFGVPARLVGNVDPAAFMPRPTEA